MMDEEKWINKLKSRLHDCEETPPADGWERLAGALPQPAQPARRTLIPLWRSWQVAAAAAVVVAVFAAGFWLLNADIAADMQQMHQPGIAQSPSPIPVQTDGRPSATAADSATVLPTAPVAVRPGETVTLAHILPKAAEGEAAALLEAAEATEATKATEASVPDSGNTPAPAAQDAEAAEASSERQPASEPERRRTVRPSSKDKLHLPADDGHRTREGWGMTLAVGNAGGLLAGSQTVPDYVQSDAQGSGITILQDQSMQIPADQEVCFMNGLPYLRKRTKRVASIDHKQPISFGIGVRKNLTDRFSVETGLTYTYLASDVLFEGASQDVEQKLHYLGIPIRANWTVLQSGNFSLYLSGGGAIEKCVYGKTGDETTIVNPVQLSVAGSVGAQYKLGKHVGIYFEPGVSYYFDDRSDIQTIRKEKPCTFTMQGGVRLTY